MKRTYKSLPTYLAAMILLCFGIIYLFRTRFMPYHGDAAQMEWSDVPAGLQFVIEALMRAAAGGFISTAVAIIALQFYFQKFKIKGFPLLILCLGSITMLCLTYAILTVDMHTPGRPPLMANFAGELLLITGFILNRKSA